MSNKPNKLTKFRESLTDEQKKAFDELTLEILATILLPKPRDYRLESRLQCNLERGLHTTSEPINIPVVNYDFQRNISLTTQHISDKHNNVFREDFNRNCLKVEYGGNVLCGYTNILRKEED